MKSSTPSHRCSLSRRRSGTLSSRDFGNGNSRSGMSLLYGSPCSILPVGACEASKSSTLHGGFYCLLPIQARRVIAVVARYRRPGQLEYKAFSIFVREDKLCRCV
ncbi:hypothetical protein RHGRI_034131 [Rhododendron griersonianum]|uniref:Uncharacterized protein n=1 Tax=Rhododendron griersonianum TaxID=479676 RepID=A0AAV6HZE4_9ERIC|nr:hypothetical protein RHGRI_034131 [Rhododendron griersonianum]